ncbi:T9SS type A sorting domain-containing protein, partial [candidate division KSB1 bacterium]|nr:T9SS type A sorting domain-containing protein [candidate division KSB1 bacterium]
QLPQASAVKISIFNTSGQMVRELVDTFQPAGSYRVQWDARDQRGQRVASGIYLYRLRADGFTTMRRMVLLK